MMSILYKFAYWACQYVYLNAGMTGILNLAPWYWHLASKIIHFSMLMCILYTLHVYWHIIMSPSKKLPHCIPQTHSDATNLVSHCFYHIPSGAVSKTYAPLPTWLFLYFWIIISNSKVIHHLHFCIHHCLHTTSSIVVTTIPLIIGKWIHVCEHRVCSRFFHLFHSYVECHSSI